MAEVSPVDLGLLARQAAQAQIGLCRPAWPMTGNKVTEVIRTAAIAALAHHDEQTARRQFRELLQRRADERQIRLDLLASRASADRLATILAPPSRGARATAEQWYRRATSRHGDSVKFALQDQAGWSWCSPRFRPRLELRQRRRRNPMRNSDIHTSGSARNQDR